MIGVGLLGLGMVWGGRLAAGDPVAVDGPEGPRLPQVPAMAEQAVPADTSPAVRPVDEGNSEAVPRGRASGWQRLPPRPPLGPSGLAVLGPKPAVPVAPAAPDPGLPRRTLLFGPVATAAGRIEAAGHVIELEGLRTLDPATQCDGQNGRTWPCGMVARAAFRAWLRGRAVECIVTPLPLPKPVLSLCHLGGKDAAEWLVRNGLAEALPGGAYEQAGRQAQAERRGIFGDRPRMLAVPVAEPVDAADGSTRPIASTVDPPPLPSGDGEAVPALPSGQP